MREFLFTLTGLTLGGSAAVCLLALAGRSTRARYGARWRCLAWLLLCLRLAVPLLTSACPAKPCPDPGPRPCRLHPAAQRAAPAACPRSGAECPDTWNLPQPPRSLRPDRPRPSSAPAGPVPLPGPASLSPLADRGRRCSDLEPGRPPPAPRLSAPLGRPSP